MTRQSFYILASLLLCSSAPLPLRSSAQPFTRLWRSRADFEACTRDGSVDNSEGGVRLARTTLLQDEQGMTHHRNTETLSEKVWAKKEFVLDNADVTSADLIFFGTARRVAVNGVEVKEVGRVPSGGWSIAHVPPKLLRKGVNQFIFSGGGSLLIENSLHPNRSARSADGGASWDDDALGEQEMNNGEYVVRLRLGRYAPRGVITSEVVDLEALASKRAIGPRLGTVRARFNPVTQTPKGTSITFEARAAATLRGWRPWKPLATVVATNGAPLPRYLQWRATLTTTLPQVTPTLQSVTLTAGAKGWHRGAAPTDPASRATHHASLKVLELTPVAFAQSSYSFAYQPPSSRLNLLRTRYKLEEVIAQGKTELEQLVALREWARFTAPKGWDHGTTQWCPPWDALIILETNQKPIALCMCTHYSTLLVQAALSLGFNARHVILDHHCVAEVWSNQFRKWILMDAGCSTDPTLNCHFEKDGVPLNALEIHNLWRAGRTGEVVVVYTPPRGRIRGDEIGKKPQCGFENYVRFAIPFRNNHLETPFPGELTQGESQYYCDAYLWWQDGSLPSEFPEYSKLTNRPADFYWTLNETTIDLKETDAPDTLQVTLHTVTPNFDRFLVSVDGGAWQEKPAAFAWKLRLGRNELRVKSVNKLGREGVEGKATVILGSA